MKPRYTVTQEGFADVFEAVNMKYAEGLAENMLKEKGTVTITDRMAHKNKPNKFTVMKCHGDAHSNPMIDHCMVCMPRWGIVVRPVFEFHVEKTRQTELNDIFLVKNLTLGTEEYETFPRTMELSVADVLSYYE